MGFKLTRETSWFGSATSMDVHIDGEEAGRTQRLETQYYELPKRKATLTVSQQNMKSNALEVEEGDEVLLKGNKKYMRIIAIFFISLMAVIFFIDDFLITTTFIVFLSIAVFHYLSKEDAFALEKVKENDE